MDVFSTATSYALLAVGFLNFAFVSHSFEFSINKLEQFFQGFMARFAVGGPGMAMFKTGRSSSDLAKQMEGLKAAADKVAEISIEKQQLEKAVPVQAVPVVQAPVPSQVTVSQPTVFSQLQPIDPILAAASGYEVSATAQQSGNMSNIILQQRGMSIPGSDKAMESGEIPNVAAPARLLSGPFDNITRGKMWQSGFMPPRSPVVATY